MPSTVQKSEASPSESLSIPRPPPYNTPDIDIGKFSSLPTLTKVLPLINDWSQPPNTFLYVPLFIVNEVFPKTLPAYPPPNTSSISHSSKTNGSPSYVLDASPDEIVKGTAVTAKTPGVTVTS